MKRYDVMRHKLFKIVAPRAGAWIETFRRVMRKVTPEGRPPRGGVD